MASFSDSIKLTIDVVTGNAKGQFKGLSQSVGEAEGAFGKMKAAGTGAFDMIKANAGALAMGAGAALVGFGVKAVGAFQDVALGAGELRDKLGLSADAASRWQEVSHDLGISTGSLSTAMGRMLKTAGSTPAVFEQLGVSIARAKDGTVDANGTFLNVINALHNMKDPAERAAAAQKLLGKSWMESAELIEMGAEGVKARLDEVAGAKIIDDKEIDKARQFRDSLDNLHDAVENVTIAVGEELVPALTEGADTLNSLIGPAQRVYDTFNKFSNLPGIKQIYENFAPWKQLPTRLHQVGTAFRAVSDAFTTGADDIDASVAPVLDFGDATRKIGEDASVAGSGMDALSGAATGLAAATETQSRKLYESQAATDIATKAQKDLDAMLGGVTDKLNEQVAALTAQSAAALSSADSAVAADNALAAFGDALTAEKDAADASAEATRQHGASSNEAADALRNQSDAALGTRDAAVTLSKANLQLAVDQATAAGQTLGATQKLDIQKDSLLNTAAAAQGPARTAIMNYIFALMGIPEERRTDILTLLDKGLVAEARAAIDNASRTRSTDINVDEVGAAAANAAIDHAARPRFTTITINPKYGQGTTPLPNSPGQGFAMGTQDAPGGWAKVGERGEEIVELPKGAVVHTAGETQLMLNGSGGRQSRGGTAVVPAAAATAAVINLALHVHLASSGGGRSGSVHDGHRFANDLMSWIRTGGAAQIRRELGL